MTLTKLLNQINNYLQLMRLHQPIGILLLLWPTLWALWLAAHAIPDLKILVIFILGVIIMRSAGCVINDIADRQFDGKVMRTRKRPLATGAVSVTEALILFTALCCCALVLILFVNRLTQYLAVIGLMLAILYPFTKRFTHWPQLVLGSAFGWSVPMAYAAQANAITPTAWLLFLVALLWPLAYDTFYAMVDREDDKKIGIKSTALLFEKWDSLFIGLIQIVILLILVLIGISEKLGYGYYLSLVGACLLFGYQQYLIAKRNPEKYFQAFLNNNWVGFIIFLGIASDFASA